MKLINYEANENGISINIPIGLLKHVAENSPEMQLKVTDPIQFAKDVLFSLQHRIGDSESGLSAIENIIDEAIEDVVVMGCNSVVDLDEQEEEQ